MEKYHISDNNKLPNYFALMGIIPAILSVLAYEFLDYMIYLIHPERTDYNPLMGIGMLIPMAFLMQFFNFCVSKALLKKVNLLVDALHKVAKGDYQVRLNEKKAAPLTEIVQNFNKMTEELQSVETLRNDFINDFSHEFKTPITSINGFANLLLDTEVSEAEQREYLQIIADESKRLATLAEQTMMMSKLDSQVTIPDKEWYPLDRQLKQNIILLSKDWEAKGITIDTDIDKVSYHGNATLMAHVWINLLGNAIKFTPEAGTITVSLKQKKNSLYIAIQDTGKGMTEEEISRIFHKYYQADTSHATKGMGLGLSIAHRIVELCEGQIEVNSTPGCGSTFTVILPYSENK